MSSWKSVIPALIGVACGLLATNRATTLRAIDVIYSKVFHPKPVLLQWQVLSSKDNRPIDGAIVALTDNTGENRAFTDKQGTAEFSLPTSKETYPSRLTIQKNGFVPLEQSVVIGPKTDLYRLYMKELTPATTPETHSNPIETTEIYTSGPRVSGGGEHFSDWYELCSGSKEGYFIQSSEFKLAGDRNCGAWSECLSESQDRNKVCWRFRMQGHTEWPGAGQGFSEGILKVVWTRSENLGAGQGLR